MVNDVNISISKELEEKLQERIKGTNFKSVQEYILYVLEQLVSESEGEISSTREQAYTEEEEKDIAGDPEILESLKPRQPYTEEEEKELKKNLDEMGYL